MRTLKVSLLTAMLAVSGLGYADQSDCKSMGVDIGNRIAQLSGEFGSVCEFKSASMDSSASQCAIYLNCQGEIESIEIKLRD